MGHQKRTGGYLGSILLPAIYTSSHNAPSVRGVYVHHLLITRLRLRGVPKSTKLRRSWYNLCLGPQAHLHLLPLWAARCAPNLGHVNHRSQRQVHRLPNTRRVPQAPCTTQLFDFDFASGSLRNEPKENELKRTQITGKKRGICTHPIVQAPASD